MNRKIISNIATSCAFAIFAISGSEITHNKKATDKLRVYILSTHAISPKIVDTFKADGADASEAFSKSILQCIKSDITNDIEKTKKINSLAEFNNTEIKHALLSTIVTKSYHIAALKLFLNRNPNIQKFDSTSSSLFASVNSTQNNSQIVPDILEMLITKGGADVNQTDNNGNKLYDIASERYSKNKNLLKRIKDVLDNNGYHNSVETDNQSDFIPEE